MIKIRESASVGSAVRDPARPKHLRAALLASGLFLLGGCSTPHAHKEPWVYAMSRNFYPAVCHDGALVSSFAQDSRSECAAMAILVVFALPFALDTVLLPVTVTHDLIVAK